MKRWIAALFSIPTLAVGGLYGADRAQNPYDDKDTHYELTIKADIEQGERVEIAKDRAAMTLRGWRDEYAIKITPLIPGTTDEFTAPANRPLLSKRMEHRVADVTAFIEPKEGTENEFDIDFALASKPETNVFEYKIEGAEDFDFRYQSPEYCYSEGVECPENVVDSYAVYHKTNKNHCIGIRCESGTNYAAGKVMHIYRPMAVDANGTEQWAELRYNGGILSVTVPEEFLEIATYPVRVDPLFGYTTLGASAGSNLGTNASTTNRIGRAFNLSYDGNIQSIVVGVSKSQTDTSVQMAAFVNIEDTVSDSHNEIAHVITNVAFDTAFFVFWTGFPFSNESLPTDDYILSASADGETIEAFGNDIKLRQDAGGESRNIYSETNSASGSFNTIINEDPWTETDTTGTNEYSIYAIVTASGVGTHTDTYAASGDYTWTAPTGVSSVQVACWGGGGGGEQEGTTGGAGGGGGAFASSTVAVTAGNSYAVTVASSSLETLPVVGKFSKFVGNDKTVLACGGTGATSETLNGTGGTVACSTGDVENDGGNGADGDTTDDTGGGGGGSGGPHGDGALGGSGSNNTTGGGGGGANGGGVGGQPDAGTAGTNAGAGGAGVTTTYSAATSDGGSGAYGGGGGGGGDNGTQGGNGGLPGGGGGGADATGGIGAPGQCTITYTVAAEAPAGDGEEYIIIFSLLRLLHDPRLLAVLP